MPASSEVAALAAAAEQAHRDGDAPHAEQLHRRVLALDPAVYASLEYVGLSAFQAGRLAEAVEHLRRALAARADSPAAQRHLGMALAQSGQLDAALECFRAAIRLDAEDALSFLYAGSLFEALRQPEPAASAYSLALELRPAYRQLHANPQAPTHLRQFSQRAVHHTRAREARIHDEVAASLGREHGADAARRIARMFECKLGRAVAQFTDPRQQPFESYFPGLPAQAWFEPRDYAWAQQIEADFPRLRDEFAALAGEQADLKPYVRHDPGDDGLRQLLQSLDWSSLHLYDGGRKNEAVCARYPLTMQLLERAPMLRCAGRSPEAFFSVLKPHTHITAHHGQTNYKLTVHLPIVIPGGCAIRVGGEERTWQPGRLLMFDDSFLHEAWNGSDEIRIVLLFNVWNPHLSGVERDGIEALYAALHRWRAERRARVLETP